MTAITGELLIGSEEVGGDRRSFRAFSPGSGRNLEPAFALADADDVDRAARLAARDFGVYRDIRLGQRAIFLEAIAEEIEALGPALLDRAAAETGLSHERLAIERARTVYQLRLFADVVRGGEWLDLRRDTPLPERLPFPRPDLRLRQVAIGPVAVFGASNFPLAFSVAGGDTAAALAAGCPAIVKGHPAHPGTSELVGRAVRRAAVRTGMPEGVFSLLTGEIETGTALVRHPAIQAVGFTGSRRGGLALVALAAARPEPIPVYAEMSSINPVFVLPAALAARGGEIARGYAQSLALDAGQYCTNPGLLFVIEGDGIDAFLRDAETAVQATDTRSMLTAGIHQAYEGGIAALSGNPAVEVLAQGRAATVPTGSPAVLFAADAAAFERDERLGLEVFGASSLVVRCRDAEAMVEAAQRMEGQLTATLQMDPSDLDLARQLLPVLETKVGRILANGWPTGVEVGHAMVHGGPFPATSDSRSTSVGTLSIRRFLRPVSYQNLPEALLPDVLTDPSLPVAIDGHRSR